MAANPIPVFPSSRPAKPFRRQVIAPELAKRAAKNSASRWAGAARMTVFHTLKKIDNSRLVRHVETARMRDIVRTLLLSGAVLGFCLLWGYQRFRCIELSFQLEDLRAKQAQASALNTELRLEVAGLRNPSRIYAIARKQLKLTEPLPIPMELGNEPGGAEVAAVPRLRRAREQ